MNLWPFYSDHDFFVISGLAASQQTLPFIHQPTHTSTDLLTFSIIFTRSSTYSFCVRADLPHGNRGEKNKMAFTSTCDVTARQTSLPQGVETATPVMLADDKLMSHACRASHALPRFQGHRWRGQIPEKNNKTRMSAKAGNWLRSGVVQLLLLLLLFSSSSFSLSSSYYYHNIVCMDVYIYMSYIDMCVYSNKGKRKKGNKSERAQ